MNKQNQIYRIINYCPWPGVFSVLEIFIFVAGIIVASFLFRFTSNLNNLYESIYIFELDSLHINLAVRQAYSSLNESLAGNTRIDFEEDVLSQIEDAQTLCTEMEQNRIVINRLPLPDATEKNFSQLSFLCSQLPSLKELATTRWVHSIDGKQDDTQMAYEEAFTKFFESAETIVEISDPELVDTGEQIRRTNMILSLSVGSILFTLSLILWRNRKIKQGQMQQLETEMKKRFRLNAALDTEQNKVSTLLANWPDPVFVFDMYANIMDANPAAAHMMGFSKPELLLGKNVADLQPSELANEILGEDQMILKTEKSVINKEVTLLNQTTGKWQRLLVTKAALRDQQEQVTGLAAIVRNITAQKQAEDALRSVNQKLSEGIAELEQRTQEMDLLTQMIDLLSACPNTEEAYKIIVDQLGRLNLADSGMLYMIKPSRNNLLQVAAWGQSVSDPPVFPPSDCWSLRRGRLHTAEFNLSTHQEDHQANPLICPHISSTTSADYLCLPLVAQGETLGMLHLRQSTGKGSTESEETTASWFTPQKIQRINIIAESLALSIANLNLRTTLRQQSIRDPLTGLYNRRYLEETLEREILRSSRSNKNVGLMMIDIDHFKLFNDTHGHPAADTALSMISHLFSSSFRGEDLICRYGGEEFLIMMPETNLKTIMQRAEEIREKVAHRSIQHRGQVLEPITISIGVGIFPDHGKTPEALINNVDQALYRAKNNGRNRMEVATPIVEKNMALLIS